MFKKGQKVKYFVGEYIYTLIKEIYPNGCIYCNNGHTFNLDGEMIGLQKSNGELIYLEIDDEI